MIVGVNNPKTLPGTYVLILRLDKMRKLEVGALGTLAVEPGWFAYVGSAFGPGGIAARCAHHVRISNRPHWHIDFLRAVTILEEIWFTHDGTPREHLWAELLSTARGSSHPWSGFGASDCGCESHLFHFPSLPSFKSFRRRAIRRAGESGPIKRTVVY